MLPTARDMSGERSIVLADFRLSACPRQQTWEVVGAFPGAAIAGAETTSLPVCRRVANQFNVHPRTMLRLKAAGA